MCHSVKYVPEFLPSKGQPKYLLYGVDRVGFWGEHLNVLGWYASLEDVKKEMEAITVAISEGRPSYELQHVAEVEIKGIFGQVWLKK